MGTRRRYPEHRHAQGGRRPVRGDGRLPDYLRASGSGGDKTRIYKTPAAKSPYNNLVEYHARLARRNDNIRQHKSVHRFRSAKVVDSLCFRRSAVMHRPDSVQFHLGKAQAQSDIRLGAAVEPAYRLLPDLLLRVAAVVCVVASRRGHTAANYDSAVGGTSYRT